MGRRPQAEEPAPAPLPTRRPELDVMRAFVVAGLVVFHSAVVFASGTSWFVNDPRPSPGFTVLLLWGMPLLFVVSGMGARYALRSRSAGAFPRERLGRLLVPLLTGLVVLVAPMFYLNRVGQPGFDEPYWRFWLRFLNPAAIATGIPARGTWRSGGDEFDPAHLWFLFSLLVFSILLVPAFVSPRRPLGARLIERLAGRTERHPALALLVAAVPIMAVEAALGRTGTPAAGSGSPTCSSFCTATCLPATAGSSKPCGGCGGGRWGARCWRRSCWPGRPGPLTNQEPMS